MVREVRSRFTVVLLHDCIVVEDLNDGAMSVTNDAEQVIEELDRRGFQTTRQPVVYKDTDGRWDGLRVHNAAFAGYVSLGGSLAEACAKAKLIMQPS